LKRNKKIQKQKTPLRRKGMVLSGNSHLPENTYTPEDILWANAESHVKRGHYG